MCSLPGRGKNLKEAIKATRRNKDDDEEEEEDIHCRLHVPLVAHHVSHMPTWHQNVVTHMFCGICPRTPEEEEEEDLHLTLMVQVQPFSQEQIILFYRRFTSAEGCGRLMRKKKMMMMMS